MGIRSVIREKEREKERIAIAVDEGRGRELGPAEVAFRGRMKASAGVVISQSLGSNPTVTATKPPFIGGSSGARGVVRKN